MSFVLHSAACGGNYLFSCVSGPTPQISGRFGPGAQNVPLDPIVGQTVRTSLALLEQHFVSQTSQFLHASAI